MIQTGLFLLLLAVSAVQEVLRVKALRASGFPWREHKLILLFCGAAGLLWTCATVLFRIPVYLSLFLYFLLWYLPYLRVQVNGKVIQAVSMIGFLYFSSVYLIFLGAAGIGRRSIAQVNLLTSVKIPGYLISKILLCLFYFIWVKYFSSEDGGEVHTDHQKSKMFLMFLWSCLCYQMIDSVLASFFSDNIFVPVLMISGNALILLLTFLFLRHNYLIVMNQFLEEKYQKMEEAKARKQLREEQMTRMARIDSLTGVYVRGYGLKLFESYLDQKIQLTAVYMDLDGLKKINDKKGHAAGDAYLKMFAEEMSTNLKKDDLLVRMGGDEFLAVFTATSLEETADKLTKIRKSMESPEKGKVPVFFSFGAASGQKTAGELIKEADRAMYLDKYHRKGESDTVC